MLKFENFQEAEEFLLERNFKKIAEDSQDEAIFVPEKFIPRVARAVDPEKYEKKKEDLDDEGRKYLGVKKGTEEAQNIAGDLTEHKMSSYLKSFYQACPDKEVVVFQGAVLKTPGSKKGSQEEHDFVLVVKIQKLIIALESKRSLSGKTVAHGLEQLDRMGAIIKKYFSPMLTSGEWKFVKLMHFDNNNPKLKICPECESNLIFSEEDLRTKLAELHATPQPATRRVPQHCQDILLHHPGPGHRHLLHHI